MDLGFDEVQMLLKNIAREVLEQECPITLVRAMEEDERGFTSELWQNMAELGWLGLSIPEQYGGQGMSFFDLAILLEETGRLFVPGPFISTVVFRFLSLLILNIILTPVILFVVIPLD